MKVILTLLFVTVYVSIMAQFPTSGPDAPMLEYTLTGNNISFTITPQVNNNQFENYTDSLGSFCSSGYDSIVNFEGYIVFQLLNNTVAPSAFYNTDSARLIYQTDIQNSITQLTNYEYNSAIGVSEPIEKVVGANTGIIHDFIITTNYFTNTSITGNECYAIIAYGYSNCSNTAFIWNGDNEKVCSNPTSVNELNNISVHIYPNPSSELLKIDNATFDNYSIYSALGKLIMNGGYEKTLDVSHLSNGVYTIRFSNNMKVETVKFLKQ